MSFPRFRRSRFRGGGARARLGRAEWAAYEHSVEIAPGGVFDASRFADAPAGTVIAEDTQLVYEIVER